MMLQILLIAAAIILICLLLNKISGKFGVPVLLGFIVLGMVFGSDGLFKISFDNYAFAEQVCTVALIFIMFYGGFGTSWKAARVVAVPSILLSTLGVVITALVVGLFCTFVLGMTMLEGMLIGAIISSTDAASVFSILRSKRLNLKYNTASLLEVESGSNDPCSYMLTIILIAIMNGGLSGEQLAWTIFAQIAFGVGVGIGVALLARFILNRFHFSSDGADTIFVFGMAVLSYAGAAIIGGNGYLSAYIAGIILGNSRIQNKKSLVHFFDGVTGLMQMLIFFLLGLLSFPSRLPQILPIAIIIALVLTFVARPVAVFTLLAPFKAPLRQKLLVSWAGLRGAASIVFAIMATVGARMIQNDIFHIVFFIVLFSIGLKGTLLPLVAKKLDMIDDQSSVLKTFSDYSDEVPIQFIELHVGAEHIWANKKVRDISTLPGSLLILIIRDSKKLLPSGNVVIRPGDDIVIGAPSAPTDIGVSLTEIRLENGNDWIGKRLADADTPRGTLIVLIIRNQRAVIPNGKTMLREGDTLVISKL